jgi:hypothetical protein
MPSGTARQTEKLAEALAIEHARRTQVSMCRTCGIAAAEEAPVRCSVCGGTKFQVITEEMLDKIAAMEGGDAEETTYDGRKLKWTAEAKRALWTMQDAYQRRRAKARVEKTARVRKLSTVTLGLARTIVEEETGHTLAAPQADNGAQVVEHEGNGDRKLVGRDAERNPLLSPYAWDGDAVVRLFQVPAGFMRERTQARIELLAAESGVARVDLALVEAGLAQGRVAMEEFIAAQDAISREAGGCPAGAIDVQAAADKPAAGKCPWHGAAHDIVRNPGAVESARDGLYLNEVGLMSALEEQRRRLKE